MLSLLQVLTELSHYSVFSSLSEGVNHHELICWQWFRSLLVILSLKIDKLAHWRWVFTVVHSCEFKCSNIDDLCTLHQHSHKIWQKVWHCIKCLDVSCELHMFSLLCRLQVSENTTISHRRWRRRSERKKSTYKSTVNMTLLWCYKEEELISSTVLYSLSETCDQLYSNTVLCDYSTQILTQLSYMTDLHTILLKQ